MNRADLQELSDVRIYEAKLLFEAGGYSGAYYLAGYAVECALKACFAKGVERYDFPDKNRAGQVFTHNLSDLAKLANLQQDLAAIKDHPRLDATWQSVCKWKEDSRYSIRTKEEAEAMIEAITSKDGGILPWIQERW